LVWDGKRHTQILDYLNIHFRCARCHKLGHVFKDCDKVMVKQVWRKKDGLNKDLGGNVFVDLDLNSLIKKHQSSIVTGQDQSEGALANVTTTSLGHIVIVDVSITLIEGARSNLCHAPSSLDVWPTGDVYSPSVELRGTSLADRQDLEHDDCSGNSNHLGVPLSTSFLKDFLGILRRVLTVIWEGIRGIIS